MGIQLALFALFLALLALASAGQAAFGYLNAVRLRHLMQRGATRSQALFEVVHTPGPFLSGIALLYMLSVAGATLATVLLVQPLAPDVAPMALTFAVATLLALLVQTFARGIAATRPERVASVLYGPLSALAIVTVPLVHPLYAVSEGLLRRLFALRPDEREAMTEEDLRALVDAVEETSALEQDEREMITSIFEMSDRDISEIMVPRIDVVGIEAKRTVSEAIDMLVATGHSRLPVYDEDLDHILGLVHLRDVTGALRTGSGIRPVAELVRPVHVIPETKKIDELLHEFQALHIQMAIVADEYGGTAGIVTIEDLLEEIVGEIRDEHDVEEERIQLLSDREAIMDARLSIHDANEALPLELEADEYDTIAGLVYDRLGKVPAPGDVVNLERCTIRVLSTKGRQVQRVQITVGGNGHSL